MLGKNRFASSCWVSFALLVLVCPVSGCNRASQTVEQTVEQTAGGTSESTNDRSVGIVPPAEGQAIVLRERSAKLDASNRDETDLQTQQNALTEFSTDDLASLVRTIDSKTTNSNAKRQAAIQLANHLDDYEQFVVPLSHLMLENDRELMRVANRIFMKLGVKSLAALEDQLDIDTNVNHFSQYCSVINAIGDPCVTAKQRLVDVLSTETSDPEKLNPKRIAATYGLTGFSDGSAAAIPHIMADLKHNDMNVTLFACRLIIKTGSQAEAAVPSLNELVENGVLSQRSFAVWALASIGETAEFDPLPVVQKSLSAFNVVERERALIASGLLGERSKMMEPKVREWMNAFDSNLEGQAAVTLWQITGESDEALEHLVKLSRDSVEFELNGLLLIEQLGKEAAPALDFLWERTKHANLSIRLAAFDAIAAIGPAAAPVADKIRELQNQSTVDPLTRMVAGQVLQKISE